MAVEQQKLTYEDLLAFPDDGLRREIIDGELFVSPSPKTRHQTIVLELAFLIKQYLRAHGGGHVFIAPLDVLMDVHDVVEPDLFFVPDRNASIITEPNIEGIPSLVIEVLSNPRLDRRRKRDLYERVGVEEYWIVDPDADRVEVYVLRESRYGKPNVVEAPELLTTEQLPGLTIDLEAMFARA